MPDPDAPPQPHKPKRFWLFAPYVALLVLVLGWSAYWWVASVRLRQGLEARAEAAKKAGFVAQWSSYRVDGYPFRLRVVMIGPKFADSAGWGLSATRAEAMALAYAPDRWVFAAPEGLVLSRPGKGDLAITGKSVRASASALGTPQPRFAFEGDKLTLSPAQGAAPPSFASIDRLELDLQPGPDDQAAVYVKLDGGTVRPEAGIAKLASGKPFSLLWDARLTRQSALRGSNWPGALQAWRNAGGSMQVMQAKLGIGGLSLLGQGGPLSIDPDGRLKGEVPLKIDPGQVSNSALLTALGLLGPVPLRFEDGRASIGPIPVGAALKIG